MGLMPSTAEPPVLEHHDPATASERSGEVRDLYAEVYSAPPYYEVPPTSPASAPHGSEETTGSVRTDELQLDVADPIVAAPAVQVLPMAIFL
jgi:hypothetical protein